MSPAYPGCDLLPAAFGRLFFWTDEGLFRGYDEAVNSVSGKPTDRLGNDEVYFTVQRILDHLLKTVTVLGVEG